ncbi:hypothetical protein, partial [Nostoc sp. CHAB 5715]|uniref:hypothetical protein n=1 Tax=Nostoc sp. CHAB 5715 TaxID=2780400 RepID=UPI001E581119
IRLYLYLYKSSFSSCHIYLLTILKLAISDGNDKGNGNSIDNGMIVALHCKDKQKDDRQVFSGHSDRLL